MRSTRWPNSARAAPRFTAVVVLPTPPFCMATAIVRANLGPSLAEDGHSGGPLAPDHREAGPAIHGRSLRAGRRPPVPESSKAVPGDLGHRSRHVRGGGPVRDVRPGFRLVGWNLQGLLPVRRAAQRRLARSWLPPAYHLATRRPDRNDSDGLDLDRLFVRGGSGAHERQLSQGTGPR